MSEKSGITRLWQAVIHQHVVDAMRPAKEHHYTRYKASTYAREVRDARDWILGQGKDFRMVCDMAQLCPRQVRDGLIMELRKKQDQSG